MNEEKKCLRIVVKKMRKKRMAWPYSCDRSQKDSSSRTGKKKVSDRRDRQRGGDAHWKSSDL